jgi:hypothetical protein
MKVELWTVLETPRFRNRQAEKTDESESTSRADEPSEWIEIQHARTNG